MMASENAEFDSTQPDNEEIRKKALTRLAVAGLVTATALAGLWWLDQDKKQSASKPVATPQPNPIRSADGQNAQVTEAEEAETLLGEDEVITEEHAAEEAAITQEAPFEGVPPGPPPPPKVSNTVRPNQASVKPGNAPPMPPPSAIPNTPGAQPLPSTTAGTVNRTGSSPANIKPAHSGPGFVVQLGVFNDPMRAVEMVQRLKQQGIKASTETRVHLGPFLNQQEAEKAQSAMRRLGMNTVITPAPATK